MGRSASQDNTSQYASGIKSGRLSENELADNFKDLAPKFEVHEALVASDRCYFCYDAPCMTACPTSIDIPLFIRQISTGTAEASAKTILDQNILGGMCARVCPTEVLCEQACVREMAEGKPVEIGRLQRYATDTLIDQDIHPFTRREPTGKQIAVVGAGPAGLSAAHRLAMYGHDVKIYEAREKAGGLNEFGIATYKTVDGFAQKELDWLLKIGGIEILYGQRLGENQTVDGLKNAFDAVFMSVGLGGSNTLNLGVDKHDQVINAVDFISELRQMDDFIKMPVGRNVVVVGGGMTAVDAAVQSKLLGAENVSLVYRRGKDGMSASEHEQDLAATAGVRLIYNAAPLSLVGAGSDLTMRFAYTQTVDGQFRTLDETFDLAVDQVMLAIGQTLDLGDFDLEQASGKISVTGAGRTSLAGVWAGGDCASGGDDLTVTAVAEGRDAAEDIHLVLTGSEG